MEEISSSPNLKVGRESSLKNLLSQRKMLPSNIQEEIKEQEESSEHEQNSNHAMFNRQISDSESNYECDDSDIDEGDNNVHDRYFVPLNLGKIEMVEILKDEEDVEQEIEIAKGRKKMLASVDNNPFTI